MNTLHILLFILLTVKPAEILFSLSPENFSFTWSFYYGSVLLMKGEPGAAEERELNVKESRNGDLLITISYPGPQPGTSTLVIRNDKGDAHEYVYERRQAVDAFTPTVDAGVHFIIPVTDIVGPAGQAERCTVDFFYSDDDAGGEQRIGTIVFIL